MQPHRHVIDKTQTVPYCHGVLQDTLQLVDQAYVSVQSALMRVADSAEQLQWRVGGLDELKKLYDAGQLNGLDKEFACEVSPSATTLSSDHSGDMSDSALSNISGEDHKWENEVHMVDDSENQDDSDLSTEESGREESENGSY
jgi:hypothetical protein